MGFFHEKGVRHRPAAAGGKEGHAVRGVGLQRSWDIPIEYYCFANLCRAAGVGAGMPGGPDRALDMKKAAILIGMRLRHGVDGLESKWRPDRD
ncbi:hypothetical protein [Chromobacterium aquaticum]|uniref:Uncharacterized protein n=1 Tax=Chromobacterium aquaticum TaxID=467180 RepID=A0ABV9A3D9_9NEIS|nr:hypothetical protein [Chromobacterium aquaticum]MCD5360311.1 hypothetical protein [Chromobacterium aquaticum]